MSHGLVIPWGGGWEVRWREPHEARGTWATSGSRFTLGCIPSGAWILGPCRKLLETTLLEFWAVGGPRNVEPA